LHGRVEFGDALIELATAHGVPIRFKPDDKRWTGLQAA
jgi:hypothetical protein